MLELYHYSSLNKMCAFCCLIYHCIKPFYCLYIVLFSHRCQLIDIISTVFCGESLVHVLVMSSSIVFCRSVFTFSFKFNLSFFCSLVSFDVELIQMLCEILHGAVLQFAIATVFFMFYRDSIFLHWFSVFRWRYVTLCLVKIKLLSIITKLYVYLKELLAVSKRVSPPNLLRVVWWSNPLNHTSSNI